MYKKILVTGGSGLLGHGLKAITDEFPGREFKFLSSKDCELTDLNSVVKCFSDFKPDAVMHFAAKSGGVQYSSTYPATLLRDNVLMNFFVLEAARMCGVEKVVVASSVAIYPTEAPIPLNEDSINKGLPHESAYSYAFAKRLLDPAIKAYRKEYGLKVAGFIPNGIFGEHANFKEGESIMINALIRRFYENRDTEEKIVVWGDGSPLREYTYSHDMARAFMWGLDNYDNSQILNIGSTEEHSVREIAFMIAENLNINTDRIFFDTARPGGIFRRNTDNSRFVNLSDFKYSAFKDGLKNTISWFSENYNIPGAVKL